MRLRSGRIHDILFSTQGREEGKAMGFKYIAGGMKFERFEDARRFVLHVIIPRYTQEVTENCGFLPWYWDAVRWNTEVRAKRARWIDETAEWNEENGEPFFNGKAWLLDNIVAIQRLHRP